MHRIPGDRQSHLPAPGATEMIVSTLPSGESNWLERGLLERARADFDRPLTHLVSRHGLAAPAAA